MLKKKTTWKQTIIGKDDNQSCFPKNRWKMQSISSAFSPFSGSLSVKLKLQNKRHNRKKIHLNSVYALYSKPYIYTITEWILMSETSDTGGRRVGLDLQLPPRDHCFNYFCLMMINVENVDVNSTCNLFRSRNCHATMDDLSTRNQQIFLAVPVRCIDNKL
ncbi:unnamed protein product [Acanthoscelides obtectus]|uniref:Uncharacterized protein n=1 Tax=Acanthoscelides obtectus TaxID=200917 RepID=A0A9P0QCL3_ACAOB|nr:unnamed protein product [Acanthoscelides obtectus]CAK1688728.1 hypothetical protein AOBTE_LOCUS36836 [Acanthoscelides obtectus]